MDGFLQHGKAFSRILNIPFVPCHRQNENEWNLSTWLTTFALYMQSDTHALHKRERCACVCRASMPINVDRFDFERGQKFMNAIWNSELVSRAFEIQDIYFD